MSPAVILAAWGATVPAITPHIDRDAGAVAPIERYRRAELDAFVADAIAFAARAEVIAPRTLAARAT